MTEDSVLDEVREASKISDTVTRRRQKRYLFCFVAFSLFLYLLPFCTARLPGYLYWAGSPFSVPLDYSFTTAGMNPGIVIYGDSSAMYGISPLQMSAALGTKVINLPNSGGSLPVVGDLPLRYEVSVNRPPRLIILYFAPWDLDYTTHQNAFMFEGEEVLLRHGTFREIAAFAFRHPIISLLYPFQVYATGPKSAFVAALHHTDRMAEVVAKMGHLNAPSVTATGHQSTPNLVPPCRFPAEDLDHAGTSSVRALIDKYTSPKTRVLVYIAPVPACENVAEIVGRRSAYQAVGAAPPKVLPVPLYRDDQMYTHLDPKAVHDATDSLIDAVRKTLASPPEPPGQK